MGLARNYQPAEAEERWRRRWRELGLYRFNRNGSGPVFSIDTPPPTVSGHLHLGHVFSYTHTDLLARFHRMNGYRVFYPMGFDDNGLPTERLVEKRLGLSSRRIGRAAFIGKCLEASTEAEADYRGLWDRLGLSIDWDYTYRTIDPEARRVSQRSFLDLYDRGMVYRKEAPTLWCPECHTALAQADLNDLERETVFYTLRFLREDGRDLPIATTRPEFLPACVAVLVHPEDPRFADCVGRELTVPLFGQKVPVRTDPQADPAKGTGMVMVCTFGDATDVEWWFRYRLPLVQMLDRDGRLAEAAGKFSGLPVAEGRRRIVQVLEERGLLLERKPAAQVVRVHERCDTPVEYLLTKQWFIRVLDRKQELLAAAEKIEWRPSSMKNRYCQWVENLSWDWCVSRQRDFGVPFPLWYCAACGAVVPAERDRLPVDPRVDRPSRPCGCGQETFTAEEDVLDTWATSSLTPQICGRWLQDPELYNQVFPMALRPQAHEIIRTWAFYTLVKSLAHFGVIPWRSIAVSGWGLAPEGTGKISKSRGGGPMSPGEMLARHSADAVRYWAASTGLGKDSVISEEKIRLGSRLLTKLWNVARFSEPFLLEAGGDSLGAALLPVEPPHADAEPHRADAESLHVDVERPRADPAAFTPADRWILARTQRLIRGVTASWREYDHATALQETEAFFWGALADNYLEMAKLRLYGSPGASRDAARWTLGWVLGVVVKLFAPVLPHVTEEIYQGLFAGAEKRASIHESAWPQPIEVWEVGDHEAMGEVLVGVATAVRRYKTEEGIAMGAALPKLALLPATEELARRLREAEPDLRSVTRAEEVEVVERLDPCWMMLAGEGPVRVAVQV